MKTFGHKHKMYLIIFCGLIYNLYLYQQEKPSANEPHKPLIKTVTMTDQINLKDTSATEYLKSLK
ncbi:hypothetical protein [Anditalea andensis]|uniref:Uncharacterized protein n=1 Tax=Anditalea andensis TaxID=1048983 RepID=A0A074KYY6_9BACT|nr:hypothetical protein [Anditalea andensis]KEO74109.1 hypothetical protein EL17_08165 [Anditalea andensis]